MHKRWWLVFGASIVFIFYVHYVFSRESVLEHQITNQSRLEKDNTVFSSIGNTFILKQKIQQQLKYLIGGSISLT